MKGIITAGGLGSRLGIITKTQNKHLLPVFNKPMIYYPIETLTKAGIEEILIIVSGPFAGNFIPLLKNGEDFGLKKLEYAFQSKPDGGIADALSLAENFANKEPVVVILGDNVTNFNITNSIKNYLTAIEINKPEPYAKIHLKFFNQKEDLVKYGIVEFENLPINHTKCPIKKIIEKPNDPPSCYAVTGLYLFDQYVFNFIKQLKPSERGQLEVTDILNLYLKNGFLDWEVMLDDFWQDAGTFESLYAANKYWAEKINT